MLLYTYEYPPNNIPLNQIDHYDLPANTAMAVSTGLIGDSEFYLPNNILTPGSSSTGVLRFKAPRNNTTGLYSSFQRASKLLLVDVPGYQFSDVSADVIVGLLDGTDITVKYLGVDDGVTHTLGPTTLETVTDLPIAVAEPPDTTQTLPSQLKNRYTSVANNLPRSITTVSHAGLIEPVQLYLPPRATGFSLLTIYLYNPTASLLTANITLSTLNDSTTSFTLPIDVAPTKHIIYENLYVLADETITCTMLNGNVRATAVNMETS